MIVDAAVHPLMPETELRARIPQPWRDHMNLVPQPFGKLFPPPVPEIADPSAHRRARSWPRAAQELRGSEGAAP